ncbi:MAG: prepilin-type N-terminal cleavage/methylation domain-containing protein [Gemmatimonadales bacterium]|nr:prepilin-type N-terminal cleavage/methylation domain-containing protein [Gemmatimonadales bacterium]
MTGSRKGFTLIELLIVVVIIGILAAIAIPKFGSTKDKAKLSSTRTDVRNYMSAQEAYFSDHSQYGDLASLQAAPYNFTLSQGNTGSGTGVTGAYTVTVTNTTITTGNKGCTSQVGTGGTTVDGVIFCTVQ